MVNVIISSDPRYSINRLAIQAAVFGALAKHHVKGKVEIEVSVVGDRKMHELNRKYRKINSTTDVLSFALEDASSSSLQHIPRVGPACRQAGFVAAPDGILRLGSIVVAYPQAVVDASLDGISVEEEIAFLVDHGTNHLLGIHHD